MSSLIEKQSLEIASKTRRSRFDRIVVGLDDKGDSSTAIRMANAIAEQFEANLVAVHALSRPPVHPTVPPIVFEQALSSFEERLKELITATIGTAGLRWSVKVQFDDPAAAILSAARLDHADLIIVASHGRTGARNLVLGSVAEAVLCKARCPVLVFSPDLTETHTPWKTILFATDLDETGLGPAEFACSLATQTQGRLLLLHVEKDKPPAGSRTREWVEDDIRRRLERLLNPSALGSCEHEALIAYGDAAEEILATAESKKADLIVVGTGAHGALGDHVPCRTINRIFHAARCPVLSVGPDTRI